MILRNRVVAVAVLSVALAGGLAACGDDGPEPSAATAPAESEPAGGESETTAETELPTEESAAELLVDLDEEEAEAAAEERGWTLRVTSRDGEDLPMTMDLRENRVNVEVNDGVVTAVTSIG